MASAAVIRAIIQGSRARGLDPNAVLAVARTEGLGGGMGDAGHAYGPFQLNNAGGVLTGRFSGAYNPKAQAWANSPQGINWALDQIARVARGKRGRDAVIAIVRDFERPADIPGEIAKAHALYGSALGGIGAGPPPPARQPRARTALAPQQPGVPGIDIGGVLNLTRSIVGLPESSVSLVQPMSPSAPPVRRGRQRMQIKAGPEGRKVVPPKKGHRTVKFLEAFAAPFGVQVTSTTSGNHVAGSYHYRGRAVDFGGEPQRLAALMRAALRHPQDFAEAFYTGPGNPGSFIKNGKVYPNSSLDDSVAANHHDHTHLAA